MEEKKITVKEFVDTYMSAKNDVEKNKALNAIGIKNYIPYSAKVVHSQIALDKISKRVNGVLISDSTIRYLTYVTSVINLYTNLVIDKEMPHKDYDMLRENDLIDIVFDKIGKDVTEFSTVFDMTWNDMVSNESDIRVFIASQIVNFANICNDVMNNRDFLENIKAITTLIGKYTDSKK